MTEFIYDKRVSFQANFSRWHHMNTIEREMYNEQPLDRQRALAVFEDFLRSRFPSLIFKID
jgi:hypothetical protein